MSIIKKLTSMLAAASMVFALTACSDTTYAAKSDDLVIPAGVYIYYQMMAYNEAAQKVEDIDNFSKSVIEDKNVTEWINDRATEHVKKYIAVENKFNELGLEFTEKSKNIQKTAFNNTWETNQKVYEKNGVGESSLKAVIANDLKNEQIFNVIYGEGGEKGPTSSELKKYFNDNYARIQYIPVQLKTGSGEDMNDEQKAEAYKVAEDCAEKIKSGTEFYKVYLKYANDYAATVTEAAGQERQDVAYDENYDRTQLEDLIKKDAGAPSEAVDKAVFSMSVGEVKIVKDEKVYYVVQRLDNDERPELLENTKSSVLYTLHGEEFEKDIESWTESVTIEKNEAAYKRYDPLKLIFQIK